MNAWALALSLWVPAAGADDRADLHERRYRSAARSEDSTVRARVQARALQRADRLGVALPLSGRHKRVGERMKRAMQLAVALHRGAPQIVIEDTGGTEEGAAAAVERLLLGDHVVGIAGPLGDLESRAAAFRAEELGAPLVTLASRSELPTLGPWVFRVRFGPEEQGRAAAAYALDVLKLQTFGVAWPEDRFGRRAAMAFWQAVEAGGGEVRALGSWPVRGAGGGSDGYERAARTLVGGRDDGAWPKARGDRFEYGEGKFRGYRPMVDFRGLYVAAHPAEARRLLRHLSYFDVRLREVPDPASAGVAGSGVRKSDLTGREETLLQVLGAASWSDPAAAKGKPKELSNSAFPDVFDRGAPRPAVERFVKAFRRRTGRAPTSLEAQAYDAMSWLLTAWSAANSGQTGREGVRRALLTTPPADAVTGPLSIDPDGNARMTIKQFTVIADQVRRREALDRP